MSRVGDLGSLPQLLADIPLLSLKEEATSNGGNKRDSWGSWSNHGMEHQVAVMFMEGDIAAAMQFFQPKSLFITSLPLFAAIYHASAPS